MTTQPIHVAAPPSSSPAQADRYAICVKLNRLAYREFKAYVALNGTTIQNLVEHSISEFIRSQKAA